MPDDGVTTSACPECGGPLHPVGRKTLKHILTYELARGLQGGTFLHCPDPECDVVYLRFALGNGGGAADEVFRRDAVKDRVRPYATGRERLVCHCFGYTVGEIEDDAASGAGMVPAAISEEVRAGTCACEVMNPAGH